MSQLTAAELVLQRKYAELRKKKEQKLKQQAQQGSQAAENSAPSAAGAGSPTSTHLRTKAQLAEEGQTASRGKDAAAVGAQPADTAPMDAIAAAKRALEAKKKAGVGAKRPSLKRPTIQRAAPKASPRPDQDNVKLSPSGPDTSNSAHHSSRDDEMADGLGPSSLGRPSSSRAGEERNPDGAQEEDEQQPSSRHEAEATIFVGDLPPYYTREDVRQLFERFGPVEKVRLIRSQCYGFVLFESEHLAEELVRRFMKQPLVASGHELRVNRAYGTLPDWKRGPAVVHSQNPGEPKALLTTAHPKVMQARMHGDALAQQLAQAGMHGLDFHARPTERQLVTYDDL